MMLLKTGTQTLNRLRPFKGIIFFILKISLLYIAWTLLYNLVIYDSAFGHLVTANLVQMSVHMLNFLGYTSYAIDKMVYIQGLPMVYVGEPCNAAEFFGLFACFVVAYPSHIVHKLWFIPIGTLFIHSLNIIRVVLLALNLWYSRESFDFNHKYTFIVFLYGLTFLLWVSWVKRFSKPIVS